MGTRFPKAFRIALCAALLGNALGARADKVIMRDGKIYQGHIMGETPTQILLTDSQPRFLPLKEVLTIVHEGPPPAPAPTRDQLITLETLLSGEFYSASKLVLDPSAMLHVAGGLRPHAAFEVGAQVEWAPAQMGDTAITDGVTTREYTRFETWTGGFYLKLFPAYRYRQWRWRPYVLGGYLWNHLSPKATTDVLKGRSYEAGVGVSYLLTAHWSLEARYTYRQTRYDSVNFLLREGSLNENLDVRTSLVATGIAYRFL